MADDPFFSYKKLQYDLRFDDIYLLTQLKNTGIIDHLFDEVYEVASEALLNDRYLIVLSLLDNKRKLYLDGIVGQVYDSFMLSLHAHMDDLGYYCQVRQTYMVDDLNDPHEMQNCYNELMYLTNEEVFIKQQMTIYTYLLFTTIYHNVYVFTQQARKMGITFSSMTHVQCPLTNVRTIVCYTNHEVVKHHDPAWYDRLSLLHSV